MITYTDDIGITLAAGANQILLKVIKRKFNVIAFQYIVLQVVSIRHGHTRKLRDRQRHVIPMQNSSMPLASHDLKL
jgi:metallophosphoesterase superfamily enzyme